MSFIDKDDLQFLGRTGLTGAAAGAAGAGSLGLLYMLMRSLGEKEDAVKRKEDVRYLSPKPLEAGEPLKGASADGEKSAEWPKWIGTLGENVGKGAVMYPATAAAATIPAYLIYKKFATNSRT